MTLRLIPCSGPFKRHDPHCSRDQNCKGVACDTRSGNARVRRKRNCRNPGHIRSQWRTWRLRGGRENESGNLQSERPRPATGNVHAWTVIGVAACRPPPHERRLPDDDTCGSLLPAPPQLKILRSTHPRSVARSMTFWSWSVVVDAELLDGQRPSHICRQNLELARRMLVAHRSQIFRMVRPTLLASISVCDNSPLAWLKK